MPIIRPVIIPSKALKDGRNKIRISVAHNGDTRYITTDIAIDTNKEFRNGLIVKRPDANLLNTKIRNIILRYQELLEEIPYVNSLDCAELVFCLLNNGAEKPVTLKEVYDAYMAQANMKPSTVTMYGYHWRLVKAHFSEDYILANLNRASVLSFANFLAKGRGNSTIANKMTFFKGLVMFAVKSGFVSYKVDPFLGYKMPKRSVRQCWLTTDEIKRIRDFKSEKKHLNTCRDIFMLSYYLGGINIIDLIKINFNARKGTISYIRTKTDSRSPSKVEFEIPPEALEIINRWKNKDGFVKFYRTIDPYAYTHYMAANLPAIAEATDIPKIFFYSARKSFAQHAFNLGVNTAVIDYILGHNVNKGGTSLYSYIKVTPEMATKAIRLVLDNLK